MYLYIDTERERERERCICYSYPYEYTTILLYCYTTILLYYYTTILLHYYSTMLPYYDTAVVQSCNSSRSRPWTRGAARDLAIHMGKRTYFKSDCEKWLGVILRIIVTGNNYSCNNNTNGDSNNFRTRNTLIALKKKLSRSSL